MSDPLAKYNTPEARAERDRKRAGLRATRLAEQDAEASEFLSRIVGIAQRVTDAHADEAVEAARPVTDSPAIRRMRLGRAGVNDADAIATLTRTREAPVIVSHPGNVAAFRAVESFMVATGHRTLWLLGKRGTGKSYAAMWAIAKFDGDSLLVSQAHMRMGRSWDDLFERLRGAPLVVVDDPDEHMLDWQAADLSTLLADRHNQRRRTIVTANLFASKSQASEPRQSIEGLLGPRVFDRMMDKRYSRIEYIRGESLRSGR